MEINIDKVLELVEQAIEPKQLNKIQQLVFKYVWQGLSYSEIAKETGYDLGYIKDTGFKLWQTFSNCFGTKVTKQNLQDIKRKQKC
jgi:hypothetical protein